MHGSRTRVSERVVARSFHGLAWLVVMACGQRAHGQAEEHLALVVGEQQVLDARDVASFSESTKGIVEVKVPRTGGSLVITALRHGTTSLLLLGPAQARRAIQIDVFSQSPSAIEQELSGLLPSVSQLRVRRIGSRLFVEGTVTSEGELAHVERLVKLYQGQVVSLVGLNPLAVGRRTNIRLDLTFVALRRSS
ncbi:MAG: pilus assembly protein N-terminal domain-containing protein, partial [Myxococcota bacterium]|nr:pilus assembly protein N-terminal domain-containing protein [Myxococcota bacterium]